MSGCTHIETQERKDPQYLFQPNNVKHTHAHAQTFPLGAQKKNSCSKTGERTASKNFARFSSHITSFSSPSPQYLSKILESYQSSCFVFGRTPQTPRAHGIDAEHHEKEPNRGRGLFTTPSGRDYLGGVTTLDCGRRVAGTVRTNTKAENYSQKLVNAHLSAQIIWLQQCSRTWYPFINCSVDYLLWLKKKSKAISRL